MTVRNRLDTPLGRLAILAALLPGALPVAQGAPQPPRPGRFPVVEPDRGPRTPFAPGEREQLRAAGEAMARHLVRVRIELQPVIHRVDGLKIDRPWVLEGTCGGLVVSPDPLILISASSCRPDHAGMVTGLASGFRDPPKRRYTLLLDGREVPATIWRHERDSNVFLLRPQRTAGDPVAFPAPVSFEGLSRPSSGELLGLAAFLSPQVGADAFVTETTLQPGKDRFVRPVLMAAGLHQLGMPVFFSDGRLAGIVNLPPPGEPLPRPRVDPRAAASTDGERDPLEWATGFRRPVLMSQGDLEPLVEWLYRADAPSSTPVPALGLSAHEDGDQVRVDAVDDGGLASRAGLIAGEVIVQVGERPVTNVQELLDALPVEGGTPAPWTLGVERDGRLVLLSVPID